MTCFACEKPATTREHVPPACLFPEQKDMMGNKDLRRNLITVPACTDHNLVKSGDDEYFLWVLSTNLPANSVAREQASTKLARAYQRRPALGQSMLRSGEDVDVMDSHTGGRYEAVQVPLDGPRFQKMLDLIALGLYRHHFGEQWKGRLRVHPDFVAFADAPDTAEVEASRAVAFDCAQKLFVRQPKYGDNPTVFWYQVHEPTELSRCLIRLSFYEGCTATAFIGEGTG